MIKLSYLKSILHYDEINGFVKWIVNLTKKQKIGFEVGYMEVQGYRCVRIGGTLYRVHRLAWFYTYGEWPDNIDHINGIRDDNRIINLRSVTDKENQKNQKIRDDNTSGFVGVSWCKERNKWASYINHNQKRIPLGRFSDKADAIKARMRANKKYGYHENHGKIISTYSS
jgi:hypothetical protein